VIAGIAVIARSRENKTLPRIGADERGSEELPEIQNCQRSPKMENLTTDEH